MTNKEQKKHDVSPLESNMKKFGPYLIRRVRLHHTEISE